MATYILVHPDDVMYCQEFVVSDDSVLIREDVEGDWCDEDYTCSLAEARKVWSRFTQRGWVLYVPGQENYACLI